MPGLAPPRRRAVVELGAGLVLLAAVVAAGVQWGRGTTPRSTFDVARSEAAAPAPEFELADLDGRPVRLRDFRGRVVLLNFWATWCAPCREEMPAMETLARELGPQGLTVLAVNHKEGPALVSGFVRERGLGFPVLLDAEGAVAERYRVIGLPATYLVDRRGAVVATVLGLRDWSGREARAYLRGLLAARS